LEIKMVAQHGGPRPNSGRKPGSKNKKGSLAERLDELSRNLPVPLPPKRLVSLDDKDAAAQADEVMQFAGRMMRKAKALLEDTPPNVSPAAVRDEFMVWMNIVMRAASMLLPYQRPTYRSIEVRTDRGLEEQRTRYVGDPAERLVQIVVGAIHAQPDIPDAAGTPRSNGRMCVAEAMGRPRCVGRCENPRDCTVEPEPEPVDNGDGVMS
jgi:hypothetical protein